MHNAFPDGLRFLSQVTRDGAKIERSITTVYMAATVDPRVRKSSVHCLDGPCTMALERGLPCNLPHRSYCHPLTDNIPNNNINIYKHSQTIPLNHEVTPTRDSLEKPSAYRNINIPQFYFPMGQPSPGINDYNKQIFNKVMVVFSNLPEGKAHKKNFTDIAKACDCPMYWKIALFRAAGGEKLGYVTFDMFQDLWKIISTTFHDEASRFIRLLAQPGCNYLTSDDFRPLIQDVVDTHPGLSFLQEAPEFHSRYVTTVIARIFFTVNRSWSGKVTMADLRRSNFLAILQLLDEEEDINQISDYFSYEHFYVIYCKFWELDTDHDLYIDKKDLSRHNNHAISSSMTDRIFSGAVSRGIKNGCERMSYTEFVWFLLAEEDKRQPTSIEYWFRCMDLDGDGFISMFELQYFYDEQVTKMVAMGIDPLPFEDCLCQMLDIVKPKLGVRITLQDLKTCKMTPTFFDTFFNLEKYLDHEQKDPFAALRDGDTDIQELSDWEKFAQTEYEFLVAEEGAIESNLSYEDDFEVDDDDSMDFISRERAKLKELIATGDSNAITSAVLQEQGVIRKKSGPPSSPEEEINHNVNPSGGDDVEFHLQEPPMRNRWTGFGEPNGAVSITTDDSNSDFMT